MFIYMFCFNHQVTIRIEDENEVINLYSHTPNHSSTIQQVFQSQVIDSI